MKNFLTKISCCVLIVLSVSFYSCSENPVSSIPDDETGITFDTANIFEWTSIYTPSQFNLDMLIIDTNQIYFAGAPDIMLFNGTKMVTINPKLTDLFSSRITGISGDDFYFNTSYKSKHNNKKSVLNHWDGIKVTQFEISDTNFGHISDLELATDNSVYIGNYNTNLILRFNDRKFYTLPLLDTLHSNQTFFNFNNNIYSYDINKSGLNISNIFKYNGKNSELIYKVSNFHRIYSTGKSILINNQNLLSMFDGNNFKFLLSLKLLQYESTFLNPDLIAGNQNDSIFIISKKYPAGIYSKIGNKWFRTYDQKNFNYIFNYNFEQTIRFYNNKLYINCNHPKLGNFFLIGKIKKTK